MMHRLVQWQRELHTSQGEQGQSLIIIVFAFIGLLAFVGLGVDLGFYYIERVKVGRAADAAALAAAGELPVEEAARMRALTYLQENGYDHEAADAALAVNQYDGGSYASDPAGADTMTTIWVDTAYAQDETAPNPAITADHIRVRVRQQVPMTFMQLLGFDQLPVEAVAEAENISDIDTVIVYDDSGSMEFDTRCYGCWEPDPDSMYPDGTIYPLHWSDSSIANADHCASDCGDANRSPYGSTQYWVNDCNYRYRYEVWDDDIGDYVWGSWSDLYYTVIEAEEYSKIDPDYHTYGFTPYYTYWVMQHNDKGAYYRTDRGAYLSHHPYASLSNHVDGLGVPCTWDDLTDGEICRRNLPVGGPYAAPRADYDFRAPAGDTYYVWVRGQGGDDGTHGDHVFWGVDGNPIGGEDDYPKGTFYDGADSGDWDWRCVGSTPLSAGDHTLNLWAGGPGFDADRILITTDNTNCGYDSTPPHPRTFEPNNARTDWACDPCDPRFAGRPGGQTPPAGDYRPDCNIDLRQDDLYDDEQPIRDALEAAKHFVGQLNPQFDQVGYVAYDGSGSIENELECLRKRGSTNCTPQVITNTVLANLDTARASGSTNIADAIRRGISVLKTVPDGFGEHYGRPGAAHVMILLTDGRANTYSNCDSACDDDPDLWPNDDEPAKDCAMWYAHRARNQNIVIYTITLGYTADQELMKEIANVTKGYHRHAETPEVLEDIFDELYERIFIRLTK